MKSDITTVVPQTRMQEWEQQFEAAEDQTVELSLPDLCYTPTSEVWVARERLSDLVLEDTIHQPLNTDYRIIQITSEPLTTKDLVFRHGFDTSFARWRQFSRRLQGEQTVDVFSKRGSNIIQLIYPLDEESAHLQQASHDPLLCEIIAQAKTVVGVWHEGVYLYGTFIGDDMSVSLGSPLHVYTRDAVTFPRM